MMRGGPVGDPLDRARYPDDPWSLCELAPGSGADRHGGTLFAVGNGYLGVRDNSNASSDSACGGTFINGFHDTWPIHHAEDAFGFARVGQAIVPVPDASGINVAVDGETFKPAESGIDGDVRCLDFRAGTLHRSVYWRTATGRRLRIVTRRTVSCVDRHLALFEIEIAITESDSPVDIAVSSSVEEATDRPTPGHGDLIDADMPSLGTDPRQGNRTRGHPLVPVFQAQAGTRSLLAFRTSASGMSVAVGVDHQFSGTQPYRADSHVGQRAATHTFYLRLEPGATARLAKYASYQTAHHADAGSLAPHVIGTLDRAVIRGADEVRRQQRDWFTAFWRRSDVEVDGPPGIQQAVRWNLFQLAQATACVGIAGVAAKGVTGSGYDGHYFWDSEIYLLPFLTYTTPDAAKGLLAFRASMLPAARARAKELHQRGALYPWRTISGQEASAHYAAGTAQYHIDADISFALMQYVRATGDNHFLNTGAIDVLVETARMWASLGFFKGTPATSFHIHGVTGPDEYTTVVNDNFYTNIMARQNLTAAADSIARLKADDQSRYRDLVDRLQLGPDELDEWRRAAAAMHLPYDPVRGIHAQDSMFLERDVWNFDNTPADHWPLLLHYHPLVIYRFQVLKQADVILALFLTGDEFSVEQKRADFDYYDPITTGDSTLSAVAQSIVAAEVGYPEYALQYFESALFVDLADLHRNTADGVHIASAAGVWSALVCGFGGFRDASGIFRIDPRLPEQWRCLTFRLTLQDSRIKVTVERNNARLMLEAGPPVDLTVAGTPVRVTASETLTATAVRHPAVSDTGLAADPA